MAKGIQRVVVRTWTDPKCAICLHQYMGPVEMFTVRFVGSFKTICGDCVHTLTFDGGKDYQPSCKVCRDYKEKEDLHATSRGFVCEGCKGALASELKKKDAQGAGHEESS